MDRRQGERITWACFWGNVGLTLFKGVAGVLGRSTAMIADAAHSASDIVATAVALVSLRVASRPRDESHPYGHGKAESLASGFIGLSLIAAGGYILYEAVLHVRSDVLHPPDQPEVPGLIALIAAVVSIIVKESMYQYTIRAARKLNSPAMVANAWDHRSDAFSSIPVLLGIGLAQLSGVLGVRWLAHMDAVAGGLVALFILKMAIDILRDSVSGLMDAAVPARTTDEIRRIASGVAGVETVGGVRARHVGAELEADVEIVVDSLASVMDGHEVAMGVERELRQRFPLLTDVMVHVHADDSYRLEEAEHARKEKEIALVIDRHRALHMGFHDLSVHAHGRKHVVEFHLVMPPALSVDEAHRITDDLEEHIRNQFDGESEINIHVEPASGHA